IALPAQALSARPSGDYESGTLSVKAPWQQTATAVELVIRKRAYQVHATPTLIRLDLSAHGKNKVAREVRVELKTGLDVREKVWLSAADALGAEATEQLDFTQVEDERGQRPKSAARVRFQVAGLGADQAATAGSSDSPRRAALRFSLAAEGK